MTLSDQHTAELNSSRISEEYILARGYRTVDLADRDELKEMKLPRWAWEPDESFPGLLIPMYRATGELVSHQFKPAVPPTVDGRKRKYASPVGVSNHIDVHPLSAITISDTSETLWITEGAKKSDALASRGVCALTLTGVWNWRDKTGTLGDWEDIPLKDREVVICFDADARDNRLVMLAMKRFGAWLKSKGARPQYLIVPAEVNDTAVKGADDYFAAGGSLESLQRLATPSVPGDTSRDAAFTDAFLTDTVCDEALNGSFVWAHGLGWMKWDLNKWCESNEKTVTDSVRIWSITRWKAVMAESMAEPNKDMKGIIDSWRGVLSGGRMKTLVSLSAGVLEVQAAEFDNKPDILNCPNGVVDLVTGQLSPHEPGHLMTKVAGCDYVPGAKHKDWDKALEAVPEDIRDWYQVRMGQAITGHMTPDDLLVIVQGGGANGKSTVNEATAKAAGDYFLMVSDRALMANPDAHPTELMDFKGARYAVLEETPEARRLDPQRLKRTVGTPTITARKIRQDSVTFQATHSLFLSTNHIPVVDETDHGTWRRLALVVFPFTYRKPSEPLSGPNDRRGDGSLRGRVTSDPRVHEAVLAWMVEGAMKWYASGRVMPVLPQTVQDDTHEWRTRHDPIVGFISEELVFDADSHIESAELLDEMNKWLKGNGNHEWSARLMSARFGGHDDVVKRQVKLSQIWARPGRSTRNSYSSVRDKYKAWIGVRFRTNDDDQDHAHGAHDNKVNRQEAPHVEVNLSCVGTVGGASDQQVPHTAFDLETCSAAEMHRRSDFVRIGKVGSSPVVASGDEVVRQLNAAQKITGHFISTFDLQALALHHGADYEALMAKSFDTAIAELQANPPLSKEIRKEFYSLDACTERYGLPGKTDGIKRLAREHGGFDQIPLDDPEYVSYLEGDVEASQRLAERLSEDGWDKDPYVIREHAVGALMGRMSLNGFAVDETYTRERYEAGQRRLESIRERLHTEHGFPATGAAPQRTTAGKEAFYRALRSENIGEGWIRANWKFNKDGTLSLSKDVLTEMAGKLREGRPGAAELCDAIQEMNGVRTVYGNLLDWLSPAGRVHADIFPGQASGRWSITKPGLTVLGKRGGKVVERGCLTADPGELLICFDADQVDMRAIAGHCQDRQYMEMFLPKKDGSEPDPHTDIARIVGLAREEAKPIGHGWNYGMQVSGQVRNGVPREKAEQFDRMMTETFTRLIEWKGEVRGHAENGGVLDNGFGRRMRCHPESAFTQSAALMGQGGTRDIMAQGLLNLPKHYLPTLRAVIHDEIVLSVPADSVEDVKREVIGAMTQEFKGVPITWGASRAAYRWSDCYTK